MNNSISQTDQEIDKRYSFIADMKAEGFTDSDIVAGLEDGAVLAAYEISQDEAEEMHDHLKQQAAVDRAEYLRGIA